MTPEELKADRDWMENPASDQTQARAFAVDLVQQVFDEMLEKLRAQPTPDATMLMACRFRMFIQILTSGELRLKIDDSPQSKTAQ
jgi:hypothetical protein